jgi:hypothetical protein
MHKHNVCEGVVENHPLLVGFASSLRRGNLPRSWVEYLKQHAFFAYPKTLWLKLTAENQDDFKQRNEIDPKLAGQAIKKWISEEGEILNVVFDLRKVSIIDHNRLFQFLKEVRAGALRSYIVCEENIGEPTLQEELERFVTKECIFFDETQMLGHLRQSAKGRLCKITMPRHLTLQTFEEALRTSADSTHIQGCEAIAFDMERVESIDFHALSMLSPVIHSLAHQHGVLAFFEKITSKMDFELKKYGALRPMSSYLLNPHKTPDNSQDLQISGVSMKAFTVNESFEIQDECLKQFNRMVLDNAVWFTDMSNITYGSSHQQVERISNLIKSFRETIKELVENVAIHANGLGYLMMELNPQPNKGLYIYVGDTGIGLAKGISKAYKISVRSDARAVEMALRMKEMIKHRRHLRGATSFGGRGLERVSLILEKLSGYISIQTGSAMAVFTPRKNEGRNPDHIFRKMYPIQGTHLHIFIPTTTVTD